MSFCALTRLEVGALTALEVAQDGWQHHLEVSVRQSVVQVVKALPVSIDRFSGHVLEIASLC